jgi:hypothetical protein
MGFSIFDSSDEWYYNAIIHHNTGSESTKWDAYAEGYRLAAETLSQKVFAEVSNRDTLIYPIIFLYRHYLELRFKEIIEQACFLLDEHQKSTKHHDLNILWNETRRLISIIWEKPSKEALNQIDNLVSDLSNLDKFSEHFRYPIKKNGDLTLNGLHTINLKSFYEKISPIISNLEGMSMGIRVYQESKDEITREYRLNLGSI